MTPELKLSVEAYIRSNYPAEHQERLLIALEKFEVAAADGTTANTNISPRA